MSEENQTNQIVSSEKVKPAPVGQVFSKFPTKEEWETMQIIAQTLRQGGVMPNSIDTVPKMVVALQAGKEIGLSPLESMNSLYFVNGKIAMYGEAVPNQVIRAGHTIKWGKCDEKQAEVTITRGDTKESMTTKLTMEQAEKRGYTKNSVWQKFPENMLKWRVLSMTAKFICPDALKGIGIKEDMEVEIVSDDSKFHNAEAAKVIDAEVENGTYNKHKSLDEALSEDAATEPEAVEPKKAAKKKKGTK